MKTELISISSENAVLDGLLYTPSRQDSGRAVLYFHGNTMNFYTGAARFLARPLVEMGYTFLAFNRRGHDILTTRSSRTAEGGAFQTTAEALADNRDAARFLSERGFSSPVIIGHSNGGMLGVQHVIDQPQTPALVLLSAGRGGAQSTSGGPENLFAQDRQSEFESKARELVRSGQGRELMLLPGWWYAISAESFLDRIATVPDTVRLAKEIHCPVLAIRGDQESVQRYPAEEFAANCAGRCEVRIIEGCDHFYTRRESVISNAIVDWLTRNFPL